MKVPKNFILSKTQLSSETAISVNFTVFQSFHTTTGSARGRVVPAFVSDCLMCTKFGDYCISDLSIESCVIKVEINENSIIFIVTIYRPHTVMNFDVKLFEFLNSPVLSSQHVMMIGDFYINLLLEIPSNDRFIPNLYSLNFVPTNTKPTRISSGNNVGVRHPVRPNLD